MNIFNSERKSYQALSILVCFLMILAPLCSCLQVEIVSDITMRKIFEESQLIIIYVCEQQNFQTYKAFSQYCSQHSCAYLNKANELYDSIRNFVGYPNQNYFLILDSPRQLKYVLEIKDEVQCNDIEKFESDFISHKLTPYFTSEQEPIETYEPCRKLVGTNFDQFLALKAPIKVVYLHIEHQSCDICDEMLRGFSDIAQKLYRQDVIAFGYFDIFKNDHPSISSQVSPFFLVFKQGEIEPYGIEGEQFPELQKALINIIAQQIYPDYRKGSEQKEEHREIEIEDIKQFQTFNQQEDEQMDSNNYFQL